MDQSMFMKFQKSEFFYQIVALILSFVVVHTVYIGLVRPNADAVLAAEARAIAEQEASGEPVTIERSAWVVLKDYEQEACFILMFWVMAIMGLKAQSVAAQRKLFTQQLISIDEGRRVLPEDARKLSLSTALALVAHLPSLCRWFRWWCHPEFWLQVLYPPRSHRQKRWLSLGDRIQKTRRLQNQHPLLGGYRRVGKSRHHVLVPLPS